MKKEPIPSATAIAERLSAIRNELATAEAALAVFTLDAERQAALQGPESIRGFRAKRDEATRVRDETAAIVDAWTEELSVARQREEQASRRSRYDALANELAEYRGDYGTKYRALCAGLVDLLSRACHLDKRVEAVNAALPEGAEPLDLVEAPLRHIPGVPDETITKRVVRLGAEVDELETIRGRRPIRPTPLYEVFEAPGFRHDDPRFRVPGTSRPVI